MMARLAFRSRFTMIGPGTGSCHGFGMLPLHPLGTGRAGIFNTGHVPYMAHDSSGKAQLLANNHAIAKASGAKAFS